MTNSNIDPQNYPSYFSAKRAGFTLQDYASILSMTSGALENQMAGFFGYRIETKTSIKKDAGTDDKVCLRLYGPGGKTDLTELKNIPHYDEMECGDVDNWWLQEIKDVGPTYKIGIFCPHSDAWRPEWIDIDRALIIRGPAGFLIKEISVNRFNIDEELQNMEAEKSYVTNLMNFEHDESLIAEMSKSQTVIVKDYSQHSDGQTIEIEKNSTIQNELRTSLINDYTSRNLASVAYKKSIEADGVSGIGPKVSTEFSADFETELKVQVTKTHEVYNSSEINTSIKTTLKYNPYTLHFYFFNANTPTDAGTASWFDGTTTKVAFPQDKDWALSADPDRALTITSDDQMTEELRQVYERVMGKKWHGFSK